MIFSKPIIARIKDSVAELYSHTKLQTLFDTYDFKQSNASPQNKVGRISGYLVHLSWDSKNTSKLLELLIEVYLTNQHLLELDEQSNVIHAMKSLNKAMKDAGFAWNGKDFGVLYHSKIEASGLLSPKTIQQEIERAKSNIEKDPADAITAAKAIIESTCKYVLSEYKKTWGSTASPSELVTLALSVLNLDIKTMPEDSVGADEIKKALRSLVSSAQAVNELRKLWGEAHGKSPNHHEPKPKHARLALGAAETVATYLLESYAERNC